MLRSFCNLCTTSAILAKLLRGQPKSSIQTAGKMLRLSPLSKEWQVYFGSIKESEKFLDEKCPLQAYKQLTHLPPKGEVCFSVPCCVFISFNMTEVLDELDLT